MAISKEQIFTIADELDAAGQNPTLAVVRKVLGGGSFTTISEAMNEWKARKTEKETPLRQPAPAAIADRLVEFGSEIWSLALELANGRLVSEREALETARVQLEADKQEAAELADQLTEELEILQSKVAELEVADEKSQIEIVQLSEQLMHSGDRAANAEARLLEMGGRVNDLNAELVRVNAQNTDLVKALADVAMRASEDTPKIKG